MSKTPSSADELPPCSSNEAGTKAVSWSRGNAVPPSGPLLGSRRERSGSSSSGYISRVRYEAEGGALLLGLSEPLVCLLVWGDEVLIDLVTPLVCRFLFPDLEDGL